MLVSPFTFFRGAALIMASDLADTPRSGHRGPALRGRAPVELRRVRLARAPDDVRHQRLRRDAPRTVGVGRQAAGRELRGRGARARLLRRRPPRVVVLDAVESYRQAMRRAAEMRTLDAWYAHIEVEQLLEWLRVEVEEERLGKRELREAERDIAKARTRDSSRVFTRLAGEVDGELRIVADPPLIVPIEDLALPGDATGGHRSLDAASAAFVPPQAHERPSSAGGVPLRPHGAQGRRRRQRRHACVDPAAGRPRRRRPAVPPGEGGAGVGAGAVPGAEPPRQPRAAGRRGPAADAGRQRHLPRLAAGRRTSTA